MSKRSLYDVLYNMGAIKGKYTSYSERTLKAIQEKYSHKQNEIIRKLSPTELERRGFSRKSEKYINAVGEIMSKRQAQKKIRFIKAVTPNLLKGNRSEPKAASAGRRIYRQKDYEYKNSQHKTFITASENKVIDIAKRYKYKGYNAWLLNVEIVGEGLIGSPKHKGLEEPDKARWINTGHGRMDIRLMSEEHILDELALFEEAEIEILRYSIVLIKDKNE